MLNSHNDELAVSPGVCGSKRIRSKRYHGSVLPVALIFPDDFTISKQDRDRRLSFYFSSKSQERALGFRIWYSLHSDDLKPGLVPDSQDAEEARWNCSVTVWPDLLNHFPCDLVPQCAESEDEARCPYTSDKCGMNKVEAGGRCYSYKRKKHISRSESARECRLQGAWLASLETHQEWNDVIKLQEHTILSRTWIGLKAAQQTAGRASLPAMYAATWHWDSRSVAYYLDIKSNGLDDFCGVLAYQTGGSNTQKVEVQTCATRSPDSWLCELPSASGSYLSRRPVMLPLLNETTTSRVPIVTCPLQHVTYELLACDVKSLCRSLDGAGEWGSTNCKMAQGLTQPYFDCGVTRELVPYTVVCDFREDCTGGGDEKFCVYPSCKREMWNCGKGQCVDFKKRCDGVQDCVTNLDEAQCADLPVITYAVKSPAVINFDRPGGFTLTALPENTPCPDTHFQCPGGGYCLPVYVRCNEVNDCPGHEDELWCSQNRCPGFYRCRGSDRTLCTHVNHLCDGRPQCPQHDDELSCDITCPETCTCSGLAFTCFHTFRLSSFPQLRYLEARASGLSQADVTDKIMLIHLGVQACGWSNLTDFALSNLHTLDLSDNLLHHVSFSHFKLLHCLRRMNLAGNPIFGSISESPRKFLLPALIVLNLSRVHVGFINMSSLSAMLPGLQVLDLSLSGIKSLQGHRLFQSLRVLDLRGCPVSYFTPDFMKSMKYLTYVFADNFRLCCSAVLPDVFQGECVVPSDEISSCDDLLKSSIYRSALSLFAILAILGNLSSFVYRLRSSSKRIKTGFAVFVLHLCVSDLLMGVYLAFIGAADRVYVGIYVWTDTDWKSSTICSVAGFLSFLSSEVSAFVVCLITLDRFLVLHFPFSRIRFGSTSAHIACVIVWTLGLTLSAVPLLPALSHWGFYRQTGICIPLPVTRADFAGHMYSFSVMIVCNLVLFVVIAVGQSLIYWSVRANAMSEQRTEIKDSGSSSVKSKEATIARRLLTIAMTDFLCWFPVGACGLLAAFEVAVPGEVNVAMAILVLPLNSALNPFLYTLNVMLEKRQKAQELRFQKVLHAQLKKGFTYSPTLN